MQLTLKQEQVILNKARYKVLNWGRRSGKTTVFAYEALGTALTVDGAKITYYAQTFGDARDIAWDIFLDVFGEAVVKKNETLLEIQVRNLKGGLSRVSLKGWESVVTANKGRGTENDLLLVDEVAFCRGFNENYEKVLDPTLLTTRGRAVFGSTPNGFNDFYELTNKAILNKSGEWFYSHATSYDNPHNDRKWLDNKKEEIGDDRFSQEYLADFRRKEGLVYKDFDRNKHIVTDEIDDDNDNVVKIFGGLDFGFKNPAALVVIKKTGSEKYFVTDEFYKTGKVDAEVAEYVSALSLNECYPDPENPSGIEELKRRGVNVREVVKGKKSIVNGIGIVSDLFRSGRLFIQASCVNLIWELETYSYPEKKPNHNEEEIPIKENDHLCDALRYALMMETRAIPKTVSQTRPEWISRNYHTDDNRTRPTWIGRKR